MAASRKEAITALQDNAGTTAAEAATIVDAVRAAAEDEALDSVAGAVPLPSAMSDLRAARLQRVYEHFGERNLTKLELQAIFRVGDAQAVSIDRRMRASFPRLANRLLTNAVEKSAGEVRREGDNQDGYRYVIEFSQLSGLDAAELLLERRGLHTGLEFDRRNMILTVSLRDPERARRIVGEVLGLSLPSR